MKNSFYTRSIRLTDSLEYKRKESVSRVPNFLSQSLFGIHSVWRLKKLKTLQINEHL